MPYRQTEAVRFGNSLADASEGRVNASPLDEGLIDYVDLEAIGRNPDENLVFQAIPLTHGISDSS